MNETKSAKINTAITLIIAMSIEDYAKESGITVEAARNIILSSSAVKLLKDPDTGVWREGPDAFIDLLRKIG